MNDHETYFNLSLFSVFASFLLSVWFYIYTQNLEISGFCVSKIRAVPIDHKRVKKITK